MKCKDQHCLQPSLHCLGLSSPPQNPLNLLLGKISNIHKINNSVINRSPLFSQAWAREVFFGAWRVGVSVEPFVVMGLAGPVLSTGFWVKRDSCVLRKRNVCVSKMCVWVRRQWCTKTWYLSLFMLCDFSVLNLHVVQRPRTILYFLVIVFRHLHFTLSG